MKKWFRVLLLIVALVAVLAGFQTEVWKYSIAVIALCALCFVATLSGNGRAKSRSNTFLGSGGYDSSGGGCGSGGDC
ncbi:hypothetical protein ACSLBF_13650 [Pseudoalteromonas sp. T1lg65]|uniref:hypothetical protein n=1 Tax=Pseudoalteromonas sp. T1lg65 TaxID=2077101 RepID=UPI003F7A761F